HDLDAIARGEIQQLRRAQRLAKLRQTQRNIGSGDGEGGDLVRAGVAIRGAHDPDLVHAASRPERSTGCVKEASRRPEKGPPAKGAAKLTAGAYRPRAGALSTRVFSGGRRASAR